MNFDKDDFKPLAKQSKPIEPLQKGLSYWQDSWRKLRQKKMAFGALITLFFIIGNVIFLPFIWRCNPNTINPTQKSQPPHFGIKAIVVEDQQTWQAPNRLIDNETTENSLSATAKIEVIGQANTYSIKLIWQEIKGAVGYQIFRSTQKPQQDKFGIPMRRVEEKNGFEDRTDLISQNYYYTIVAFDKFGDLSDKFTFIKVNPLYALTITESKKQGIEKAQIGKTVHLQAHPFGTDDKGRDILARLLYGGRISLFIGIIAPLFYIFIGTLYGAVAGFYGGKIDNYMMRFVDFIVALPFLLFIIIFKLLFGIGVGESSIMPLIIALVLLSWPTSARLIRGQTLQIREEPYINASRLLGGSYSYLIMRHILPNLLGLILVSLTFAIPSAIFTEAFLSFIGLGVVPPTASWGQMCHDALASIQTSPHELIFPAIFISLTVLSFNLLGDGLRDALDSKLEHY